MSTIPPKLVEEVALYNTIIQIPQRWSDTPSQITLPSNASRLEKSVLIDRIKGCIYGQVIGDAVGLATEFMTKREANMVYKTRKIEYSAFYRDGHRSRWLAGDWTDDSDQMILILESVLCHGGIVSSHDFAWRLRYWVNRGFPQLGDNGGMGLGATVAAAVRHAQFLTDPHEAARQAWERANRNAAANGAVMRTSLLGIISFNNLEHVIKNTTEIAKTTHHDPRCVSSCVAATVAIALMLQGEIDPSTQEGNAQIVNQALTIAKTFAAQFDTELETHCRMSRVEDLLLDENDKIGYTFKCIGSGFYGLTKIDQSFERILTDVVMEAGDADTNGAICGALVGCRIGYSNLPPHWLQMPHKEWLDQRVNRFLALLGLN